MHLFYLDESGTRDPSIGTAEKPKEHLYVLLAVGMHEKHRPSFELDITGLKMELASRLHRDGQGQFGFLDCEVKSSWQRRPSEREKCSPFLTKLSDKERARISDTFFNQISDRDTVVMACVVDKRFLKGIVTGEVVHMTAYKHLLEGIQCYMEEYQTGQGALIVMDDMGTRFNQAMMEEHVSLQYSNNGNMAFPSILEGPFFVCSESSNGVQLADLLAYSVYRAFRYENLGYPYFRKTLSNFYQGCGEASLRGLYVWPSDSPLQAFAGLVRRSIKKSALR